MSAVLCLPACLCVSAAASRGQAPHGNASIGDTLRLMGAGSAMTLRSSASALLHALSTRCPGDTAPYLNQARATYPGGVSELEAALHLLQPPDEDLEVGKITGLVTGPQARTPPHPQPGGSGPRQPTHRAGSRGWESARPRTPHTHARGAPPGHPDAAPTARKRARCGVGDGSPRPHPPAPTASG